MHSVSPALTAKVILLCLLFAGFYLCGWILPDLWWGTHQLAFLPTFHSFFFFAAVLGILFWGGFAFRPLLLPALDNKIYLAISLLLSFVAAWVCYQLPVAIDGLGDAVRFESFFAGDDNAFKPKYMEVLISPNVFHAKNGERTVLNAMHLLSVTADISPRQAFQYLSSVCAGLYVFLACWFVRIFCANNALRLTAWLMLVLAPFVWMFFGHMEIYTPVIVCLLGFAMLLLHFFAAPSRKLYPLLLLVLFIALKLHSVNFLLLIPLLYAVTWFETRGSALSEKLCNWRFLLCWLILPGFLLALCVYVFVLGDHRDPRVPGETLQRLFLPVVPPAPPLDRYTLQSAAHIFDFFNLLLMLSAAACFVITVCLLCYRRVIDWSEPRLIAMALAVLSMLGLYFAVNPLLGMSLDMDLFSLPAPLLIVFAVLLLVQLQRKGIDCRALYRSVLVLSLFTLPALWVNNNTFSAAKRLESLGVRTFHSYWIAAPRPILISLDAISLELPEEKLDQHVDNLVYRRLQPYAIEGSDLEFAATANSIGKMYHERFARHDRAIEFFELALQYDPGLRRNRLAIVESYFALGEQEPGYYRNAYAQSQYLLAFQYPDYQKALRIAIHSAIMAQDYSAAHMHATEYYYVWPDDGNIAEVYRRLEEEDNLETLHLLFSRGNPPVDSKRE